MNSYLLDSAVKIIDIAKTNDVLVKLIGGLAFWEHCPESRHLLEYFDRKISDIDFVSDIKFKKKFDKILQSEFDLVVDNYYETIPSCLRSVYYSKDFRIKFDVNYNQLIYSHIIDIRKSLYQKNGITLSLADLLLSKLQIHNIEIKDIVDIIVLLTEHKFGNSDEKEIINLSHISMLCSCNWGLEHTIRRNCHTIYRNLNNNKMIEKIDRTEITIKLLQLLNTIKVSKKTINWKIRNHFNEKFSWYNKVEDVVNI